ncbi:Ig-like domain-containing protein, partial [Zunongwangia profunda]|uniref:Ig-like domain-containing protein n=1 Tax=Zunongwangia profunda TaxID=398743 RepID=UPI001D192D7E
MKLTKLLTQYGIAYYSIFLLFLLSFSTICSAQDIKERKYATTFQASSTVLLNRDIKNANAAVDQNLETYAQMNTLLSLSGSSRASLRLRFGKELPAGTPVTLKVGSESQLLSLLDNVTIQAVNGVGSAINNTGNTVGNEVRLSSLASLLSGPQQREITFVPSVAYDGVKISLGGLAASFNVYEAFYYEYTGETGCPEALDILYGVSGNGLDVASLLNVVRNPSNAIDGDDNSRAELRANVSLLEEAFLEVPFNRNSLPGESARIVLQGQATGLLDLSLLSSSVEIKAFLNGQELADIDLGSSLVSLSLLGGSSDKQVLSVPISQSFDKIRISVGRGLLETLSGLNIYEIGQSPSKPELTSPSLVGGIVELCAGGDLTLSVVSPVPGSTYRWYSVSSGGSPVYTGTDYELSDVSSGSYSYYVSQSLAGCTTESERTMISVEVEALPDAPQLVESSIEVASGGDVTFEVADADAGLTYNWYAEGDTSTIVHTGETYELTDVTASSGYSVVAVSGSGCISLPTSANITLLGDLLPPKVVPATATISEGESVSFMASSDNPSPVDYVWFDEQGDEVFVGDQFTTPSTLVPGTYTYEVISRDPVTNQVSTATQVTLVVEAIEALVDCSAANAQGNGISGLLCIGCGVSNAGNAVDNDPNNFSRLTLGVGVSGSVYQELIFPQSGVSGDSIRLDLAVPGGLADVGVLGGIQVTLYNGTTQVQQLNVNDALVNLSLLSGNRFNAIFEAKNTYDRVEIRNTGLVSALTSVDIYGAYIVVPEVEVDNDIVEICAGETINFDIITETGLSYSWYDAPTGGTLLATGGSFTTSEINTSQIFYLEITRNSCLIQERIPFEVDVLPTATAGDLLTTNFDICAGGSVELAATSSVNNATIRYYTDADLTMQLTDLEVMPTQTTTYYV